MPNSNPNQVLVALAGPFTNDSPILTLSWINSLNMDVQLELIYYENVSAKLWNIINNWGSFEVNLWTLLVGIVMMCS